MKDLCAEAGIPTARLSPLSRAGAGEGFADALGLPVVIKADGLAAGKGVIIAETKADAHKAIDFMFDGGFGESGREVVVEEFMDGEEASFFALSDGTMAIPLAGAQDHKRVFDGDYGPNTGGMGAYSPAPVLNPAMEAIAMERFIKPTVAAMNAKRHRLHGRVVSGAYVHKERAQAGRIQLPLRRSGNPGLMVRLKSDLLAALLAARDGRIGDTSLEWRDDVALTVVMASKGYPGSYQKGHVIHGLEEAARLPGVQIFHAGTERRDGRIVAVGGRVLNVTATGKTVLEAQARAYAAVDRHPLAEGAFCSRDIGWRAIARERAQ